MALYGDKPILILTPKPLMEQWQEELWSLLQFPSRCVEWPPVDRRERRRLSGHGGRRGLRRCPRRAGIVSTGLIKRQSDGIGMLETLSYECVLLDEAHHARRLNSGPSHQGEDAAPTNLLRFMKSIARRTRSVLLATATPVQIDPSKPGTCWTCFPKATTASSATSSASGAASPHWPWTWCLAGPTLHETSRTWEWLEIRCRPKAKSTSQSFAQPVRAGRCGRRFRRPIRRARQQVISIGCTTYRRVCSAITTPLFRHIVRRTACLPGEHHRSGHRRTVFEACPGTPPRRG